jgi:hypothetical protein
LDVVENAPSGLKDRIFEIVELVQNAQGNQGRGGSGWFIHGDESFLFWMGRGDEREWRMEEMKEQRSSERKKRMRKRGQSRGSRRIGWPWRPI